MTARAPAYRAELLDWLLGRLSRRRESGSIARAERQLTTSPALWWWIFEGRLYPGLDRSLASSWHWIDRQARRLLISLSPVWRVVDSPEGETDWVASAFHALTSIRPVFVSRASRVGLAPDESETLLAWLEWIRLNWASYVADLGPPEGVDQDLPWTERPERLRFDDETSIRRWAHIAKRSRWPLLRNIVAESLRCVLEPQDLVRLPLPAEHDRLFELLCLVRILRTFEPRPRQLRWLDLEVDTNLVQIPGVKCRYQQTFPKHEVIATAEFAEGLRAALNLYKLSVPTRSDAWFVFDRPRQGYAGLLVEMKSGRQTPDAAIYQLRCYRAALRKLVPDPVVLWGIVEEDWMGDEPPAGVDSGPVGLGEPSPMALPERDPVTGDQWVFSTAESIPAVLGALGLGPRPSPQSGTT